MSQQQDTGFTREIAKIETTFLGVEDHGILTATLRVNYGGASQSIAGYALDDKPSEGPDGRHRRGTAEGVEFVARLLRACGVRSWEQLPGRTVYVLFNNQRRPMGVENLPTERGGRFLFDDLFVDDVAEQVEP
jgi:hypothetical protein